MSYDSTVILMSITPYNEQLVENAGRLCYDSVDKLGQNDNWIQQRIKQGHESLLEHASATFFIKCSRVVTHELVRHRIASYSQRSQRYVKEDTISCVIPPELAGDHEFQSVMSLSWTVYNDLLKQGIKPEIARYVLPNACFTEIICTWNFREIRHILKLRTSQGALPEMREIASKIKEIMIKEAPKVFGDLK
jgi:thymidylate synthase (FAD)